MPQSLRIIDLKSIVSNNNCLIDLSVMENCFEINHKFEFTTALCTNNTQTKTVKKKQIAIAVNSAKIKKPFRSSLKGFNRWSHQGSNLKPTT